MPTTCDRLFRNPRGNPRLSPLLKRNQFSPKHEECLSLVGMLTTTTTTRHNSPGGKVDQADPTLRDVLVLPAFTTRTEHLDPTLYEEFGVRLGDRNLGIGPVFRHRRPLDGTKVSVIFYSTVRRSALDIESAPCL